MGETTGGIDLGGTKIQAVVMHGGRVLGQAWTMTPRQGGGVVVDSMANTLNSACTEAGLSVTDIDAIGVGSPGRIDSVAGVVHGAANVPGFGQRFDLLAALTRALGTPKITLGNDGHVATLGERYFGAGRLFKDFMGLFIGTGVGGGLVLDGKLRTGRGATGDIGHTLAIVNGRRCACGRAGCLEAYAAASQIDAAAWQLRAQDRPTSLFDTMTRLSSRVIALAAADGDTMAKELVSDAIGAIAIALARTQDLLDLEAFVIGGGLIVDSRASLPPDGRGRNPIVEQVKTLLMQELGHRISQPMVVEAELGALSGAIGASVLPLETK